MNLWYVDSGGGGHWFINICSSYEGFTSVGDISVSLSILDSRCDASKKDHHITIHTLWSVSYVIWAWPPGANLIPKKIFMNSYGRWCPLVSKIVMFIVSDSDASNTILSSYVPVTTSISNQSWPIWIFWHMLCQDLSLVICMSFQGFLIFWFFDVIALCPATIYPFFTLLQVPVLCIFLILLELEVALLVASVLVGSCIMLFFFVVRRLICYLPYNLPPLPPIRLVYDPLYLLFTSFVFIDPVWCLCLIIGIVSGVLMDKWCFPPLPGLLFSSL